MYIEVDAIITAGKLIGAIATILGVILAVHKWYLKQESLDEKISELEHKHVADIKQIEEEACLHTYGILACLKGLQEKGCNGPVTEAIEKYEKYLNKRAHDQED